MGMLTSNGLIKVLMVVALMVVSSVAQGGNFKDEFEPTFGDSRVRTHGQGGQILSLSLDQTSGSGFRSKKEYLYGRVDMQIKLVPGNSAGTVTTFYLSSEGSAHDEIDFEFLGNASGQPYTLHTNVFGQGKGGREQQFHLWFDPTKNFHTYSIVWNTRLIMFLVDDRPIRVFRNHENIGVPFPKDQPMRIYASLWEADNWATQGGLVKTNWTNAPFTAFYRNFNIDGCAGPTAASCASAAPTTNIASTSQGVSPANTRPTRGTWRTHDLDQSSRTRLKWAQKYFMVYNYCQDLKRFPQGFPPECKRSTA